MEVSSFQNQIFNWNSNINKGYVNTMLYVYIYVFPLFIAEPMAYGSS